MLCEAGERSWGMARISVAWFAVLAVASMCFVGHSYAQDLSGKGGVGGSGGFMLVTGDKDLSRDAQPRLVGNIDLRYVSRPWLGFHGSFGRGWNSYSGRNDTLAIVEPITFGVEYRQNFDQWPRYVPHAGVGFGVYSVYVRERLKVTQDPVTLERRHTISPGVNVTAGLEYFMTHSVTVSYDFVWHKIFSENVKDFPSGFGGDYSYVQLVVGVNYYFSMDILKGGGK
jgi:opacity protein-like surface antigen